MPCSMAWNFFGQSNGARSFYEMRSLIARYRKVDPNEQNDFHIGCRILTQPFFLPEERWIKVPESFAPNIVSFKTYSTEDREGLELWERLSGELDIFHPDEDTSAKRWGKPQIIQPRLGQGAFRAGVVDAYGRTVRSYAGTHPSGS